MKILVSRTDRAGDVILSTPIFSELKKAFPKATVIAHVREYTEPIIRLCPSVNHIITDDKYQSVFSLAKALKKEQFTHAILVHPSYKALMATFLARIPCRIGRASNIWQFLLTNRQVQKRSKNEKHEFQHNLDLIKPIVDSLEYQRPILKPNKSCLEYGIKYLQNIKITNDKPVIIHPGHSGSAHNLAIEQYVDLADSLIKLNIPVVISLGPNEEHLETNFTNRIQNNFGVIKNIPDFEKLAGIFHHCSAFIGGSTGPMHLAGAIELPVVVFFPPQKSMTPVRWGPCGAKNIVIKPKLEACNGKCNNCSQSPCMEKIDLDRAIKWITTSRRTL